MFITAISGIYLTLLAMIAWQDLRLGEGKFCFKA